MQHTWHLADDQDTMMVVLKKLNTFILGGLGFCGHYFIQLAFLFVCLFDMKKSNASYEWDKETCPVYKGRLNIAKTLALLLEASTGS